MRTNYTPEYEQLLAHLILARKHAGLTQHEVALRLGRLQTFVSKYERGERCLDIFEFIRVTNALGLKAADIIMRIEAHGSCAVIQEEP